MIDFDVKFKTFCSCLELFQWMEVAKEIYEGARALSKGKLTRWADFNYTIVSNYKRIVSIFPKCSKMIRTGKNNTSFSNHQKDYKIDTPPCNIRSSKL